MKTDEKVKKKFQNQKKNYKLNFFHMIYIIHTSEKSKNFQKYSNLGNDTYRCHRLLRDSVSGNTIVFPAQSDVK